MILSNYQRPKFGIDYLRVRIIFVSPFVSGIKHAYKRYGIRPRYDGEVTDSTSLYLNSGSNKPLIHPMTLYPSSNSQSRRRITCRNSAIRLPLDGCHIWPSALQWHLGKVNGATPGFWLPSKIAWEPYSGTILPCFLNLSGNTSMMAVSFDPAAGSGGYISSSTPSSVVRIYDSLSQELMRCYSLNFSEFHSECNVDFMGTSARNWIPLLNPRPRRPWIGKMNMKMTRKPVV